MNRKITKTVVVIFSVLAAFGASVGCYFGVRENIQENYQKIPVPTTLASFFPDRTAATKLEDYDPQYILEAYEVQTSTGIAYYYDLESAKGYSGTFEFFIGVRDGEVTNYYCDAENGNIGGEHSMGFDAASKSKDAFIGYTLEKPSENVLAGTTVTWKGMEQAVIAALTDAANRG